MRRAIAWRLAAVGLAAWFLAPPVHAADAPKQESGLAQVPEVAPIVVHVRGFERSKERLLKMIENAVPDLAPMVKQEIENRLRGGLEGREMKGLPKDGSIFVAFMELPDPQGTPPKVAFILRVAKYTDFRDGLLKEDERKEVKVDAAGIETATIGGETVHFVDRKGYAVITLSKDVAEQFTKKFTGLDGRLSKETAKKLVESDAALYVDMGAINQKYGDQLKQGAQLLPLILGQIGQGQIDKRTQETIQGTVEGALQLLDDSRAILIAADFHPEGLAVHGQLQVKANSKSNKYLKSTKPGALDAIGKLAAGQLGYWAVRVESEQGSGLPSWFSALVNGSDDDRSKAIKEALEELGKAGLRSSLSDATLPLESFQVEEYKDANKASAATLKLLKGLKLGEGPESVIFKEKPKIKENDQTHREFKLHNMRMALDFDKLADAVPGGKDIADSLKKIVGESQNVWFGTDGKVLVQITAKNWESARKRLDQYLDGKDILADQKAYQEARKHLPAEGSMLNLFDVPRSAQIIAEVVVPILKAQGMAIPIELSKNAKLKTAYVGMAVTLQSERGSFDFWLPAAAIAEVRKMLDPAKGAAEKE